MDYGYLLPPGISNTHNYQAQVTSTSLERFFYIHTFSLDFGTDFNTSTATVGTANRSSVHLWG